MFRRIAGIQWEKVKGRLAHQHLGHCAVSARAVLFSVVQFYLNCYLYTVSRTSLVAQMVKNAADLLPSGDPGSIPRSGKFPGEGNGNPLQYACLGKSHGCRSLAGPWSHESQTQRNNYTTTTYCLFVYILKSESESRSVMSSPLRPHELYSPWNSPGQNTGVGSLFLLQGIFPNQGSNSGLPHCRQILYQLSHQGSPRLYRKRF